MHGAANAKLRDEANRREPCPDSTGREVIAGDALKGELFRSVIKPKPEDHLHWYDRVLRAIGGLILLAVFIYFVVAIER